MDIISFSNTLPRAVNRINLLREKFSGKTFYYSRDFFQKNQDRLPLESVALGSVADGSLLDRLLRYPRVIQKIKKLKAGEICYCFGSEMALLAFFSGYRRIVLEVGDLRITKNLPLFRRFVLSFFESFIVSRVDLVVVTSPGFIPYFKSISKSLPVLLEENKYWGSTDELTGNTSFQRDSIVIGYAGALRYEQILMLIKVVGGMDGYRLNIHGDGMLKNQVSSLSSAYENVTFFGGFESPRELKAIYSSFDMNFCVYDSRQENVRIALPNKLYESIVFGVPIIVARGTLLADYVSRLECGVCVDSFDDSLWSEALLNTDIDDYKSRMRSMKRSDFCVDGGAFLNRLTALLF